MKYIDLFAWLGWFHNALKQLWHECVFSSEINKELRELYKENFNCEIEWDITKIDAKDIPAHDILCAWFPCQPFSHAGKQNWLECDKNGNLFYEIIRILSYHKPNYFILENVANLKNHNNGNTWKIITTELKKLWYSVDGKILSPHQFWIPHHRKRIFIVWSLLGLSKFKWPIPTNEKTSIKNILDKNQKDAHMLGKKELEVLNVWQELLTLFPKSEKFPSFPIWATEFWATYPYEDANPLNLDRKELEQYRWAFWVSLKNLKKEEQILNLPSYVHFAKHKFKFPSWKIRFIKQNREFYHKYKDILDIIIPKLKKYPLSFQKFEWNCQWEVRNLFKHIIQFRASGIRIKKIDTSPSLISSTSSQIPIIGWEKRYLTSQEASKLQWMWNLKMPTTNDLAFKALWNALNSDIVLKIITNLLKNT